MRHARPDYARIQDPSTEIPHDEPVMLFRAQDKYAPEALKAYASTIEADPTATKEAREVAEVVRNWIRVMKEYAKTHISKNPDL